MKKSDCGVSPRKALAMGKGMREMDMKAKPSGKGGKGKPMPKGGKKGY